MTNPLDALKGWRTLIVNAVALAPPAWDLLTTAAAAFIPAAQQYKLFDYIPDKWKPLYVVVLVILNVMLRFATTTPVGKK